MSESNKKKSIFSLAEFAPYQAAWQQRTLELSYRRAYYDGTIYRNVRDRFAALGRLSPMIGPRLYRGTKALYLMLSRAVDVDAGIIPGGWKLAADTPPSWAPAIKQIFAWSDWARDGVLYSHYGAQNGVSVLKIADLRAAQRVIIKPIDPSCAMLVRAGQYDSTPRLGFIIEERTGLDGQPYEYAEVITAEQIRTFADGEPAGVDGREAEYDNELGYVPLVEVRHIHTGEALGECTYQKAIPLLDEVNELASYLADIIRKHAEAQWAVIGAEPSDMVKSGDNVWFIPMGGDVKAMVAGIDIPGVLSFINSIRDEVKGALPELAFDELKSKSQIATATLELQLMELVLKIKRVRPNYDHGLADALRLAGRAANQMGLTDLAVLDDEALAFDEKRPVLPLDRETEIRIEQAELSLDQQRLLVGSPEGSAPARSRMLPTAPVADEEAVDA